MQPEAPQNPRNVRDHLRRALRVIRRHPFMKLAALLLAIVFWVVVIASDPSLLIEKTFTDAVVTVQGLETLRSRGYTVMRDLENEVITVRFRAEVTQGNYDRATASSFLPRLDLSQIMGPGKQRVYFTAGSSLYGEVVSFEPAYLELEVEPYTSRSRVPVVTVQTGENEEGLWLASVSTDPSSVTVSGPKSLVDDVRRAAVTIPLDGLSSERLYDSLSSVIELQDAQGNAIVSPLLRITNESITVDSVRVDVHVYPTKQVPVSVESAVTGVPAHGYTLGEVRVTPQTVLVAGDAEVLASLDVLHVASPLDVSGQSVSQLGSSALSDVETLVYRAAEDVIIEAQIVQAEHVHTYQDLEITVMNLDPSLTAKLSRSSMSAVLSGQYEDVEGLTADDIHLYVDAQGLGEGVYMADVLCRVDGTQTYTFTPESAQVTLTLSAAP